MAGYTIEGIHLQPSATWGHARHCAKRVPTSASQTLPAGVMPPPPSSHPSESPLSQGSCTQYVALYNFLKTSEDISGV